MPNNLLMIDRAEWAVDGEIAEPSLLRIKGISNAGGIEITEVTPTLQNGVIFITDVMATATFPAAVTYYGSFTIEWKVSFDGGGAGGKWYSAGSSQNVIYVCLGGPGPNPYRTVIHLACFNQGATTQPAAMNNSWALFSDSTIASPHAGPKGIKTWDGRLLYYYKPGTTFPQNSGGTVGELLGPPKDGVLGSARCGVWARFLKSVFDVNGIASSVTNALIDPSYAYFWVNKWTINSMPGYFTFPGASNELLPVPVGGYVALTNAVGAAGQNSPTPSQKCWPDHAFVEYDGAYYDPSYGLIYTGEANFQSTCILCVGIFSSIDPAGRAIYYITQPTSVVITFL